MPDASTCALCGETRTTAIHGISDRLYRTTEEIFTVARCGGCGLARLDPPPAQPSLYYPTGYWHEPGRLAETYRRLVIRDHVRFARRALKDGRRVLDVGCGSGLLLRELRATKPDLKVMGLDASTQAAAIAWRAKRVPVVTADLTCPPLPEASFDLITMYHVLEHLNNPAAYVEAARRLLAPGGKLVAQVPNLDCWQYRVFGYRWSGLDVPRHLYDFRLDDLRRLLSNSGFRIERVKHFSWRDNPAGLATTMAPGLEPVARSVRGAAPRNLLYLALTAASLPFAALEALCGHGSSVMVEAAIK